MAPSRAGEDQHAAKLSFCKWSIACLPNQSVLLCCHVCGRPLCFSWLCKQADAELNVLVLQVTSMARQMVVNYGFSDIGPWNLQVGCC